jgi:ribonuclease HI
MLGWAQRWRAKGWKRSQKTRAINPDLWERLLDLCAHHQVTVVWLKGHAGDLENERCDALSVQAAQGKDLPTDVGYEDAAAEAVQTVTLKLFE